MAPVAGALWLFLLCLPSVINAETNRAKRLPRDLVNYVQYYHSKPSSRHVGGGHSYPSSHGHSGTGKRVTSAPHTTPHIRIQQTRAPVVVHKYPPSGGGSGSGHNPPYHQGTPGTHSYPPSHGGSGGTQQQKVTPAPHSYPQGGGGSGSGNKLPYQQGTSGTHSYPPSGGGSGSGKFPRQPVPTQGYSTGVYPHPTWRPGSTGYNNGHVYVRNQQTNIGITNYHTTNVHNYHYRPPQVISYSGPGAHHGYYPAYTGVLPYYVYEYRASRSRFRYLLTGLALYNFGLQSQNSESHRYHNSYTPNVNEICRFGVRQYEGAAYEEVDIDCRLITHFMWSERYQTIGPEQMTTEGFNALGPKFYGDPLKINPKMKCYIKWRDSFFDTRKKEVDCGLLQTYVDRSFNSATKMTTTLLVVVTCSFMLILLG